MSADRPAILSARVKRQGTVIADADSLKATDKANRPGSATLDEVRNAYADAMNELTGEFGSVAAVNGVETPTERLQA